MPQHVLRLATLAMEVVTETPNIALDGNPIPSVMKTVVTVLHFAHKVLARWGDLNLLA